MTLTNDWLDDQIAAQLANQEILVHVSVRERALRDAQTHYIAVLRELKRLREPEPEVEEMRCECGTIRDFDGRCPGCGDPCF